MVLDDKQNAWLKRQWNTSFLKKRVFTSNLQNTSRNHDICITDFCSPNQLLWRHQHRSQGAEGLLAMVTEAEISQPIARVASVYCRIDHELDRSKCCAIVVIIIYCSVGKKVHESPPKGVFYQVHKTIEWRFSRFCNTKHKAMCTK